MSALQLFARRWISIITVAGRICGWLALMGAVRGPGT
jgi:6-phosphofructokinase